MDEARAIEDLKTLIQDTEDRLERYKAALVALLPQQKTSSKKGRGSGKPFAKKYSKPAHVYAEEEFSAVHPDGLAVRELQDRLAQRNFIYNSQGMRLTIKKMEKKGQLRRTSADPGDPFKYRWVLVK